MAEVYAKDIMNKSLSLKNKGVLDFAAERTTGNFVAAGVGALTGLAIGYTKKYSLLMSMFIGAVVGGAASSFFLPNK